MSKKFEVFLVTVICICVIGIAAMQIFYKSGIISPVFKGNDDNAVNYLNSTLYRERGLIQLEISHYPDCAVLINGEAPVNFKQDKQYLIYEVYDKDVVELDLRKIADTDVVVLVAAVSDNVTYPKEGSKFIVKNGIKILFEISCNKN